MQVLTDQQNKGTNTSLKFDFRILITRSANLKDKSKEEWGSMIV